MQVQLPWKVSREGWTLGVEVTGGCKVLHPVDDGSQTWVLWKRQDLITEPPLPLGYNDKKHRNETFISHSSHKIQVSLRKRAERLEEPEVVEDNKETMFSRHKTDTNCNSTGKTCASSTKFPTWSGGSGHKAPYLV